MPPISMAMQAAVRAVLVLSHVRGLVPAARRPPSSPSSQRQLQKRLQLQFPAQTRWRWST